MSPVSKPHWVTSGKSKWAHNSVWNVSYIHQVEPSWRMCWRQSVVFWKLLSTLCCNSCTHWCFMMLLSEHWSLQRYVATVVPTEVLSLTNVHYYLWYNFVLGLLMCKTRMNVSLNKDFLLLYMECYLEWSYYQECLYEYECFFLSVIEKVESSMKCILVCYMGRQQ